MKTLKESLLDDIETTMKGGDKWMKKLEEVQIDLKYISNCINNFDPNNATASQWYLWRGDYTVRATIFFRTPKLTKYFNLPGKHIFIAVVFNKIHHTWDVDILFSNANKTIIDNKLHQLERIGSIKGSMLYRFDEKNIPIDKETKFRVDEFIRTYVSRMFNDSESFKQYIVEPYEKGNHRNKETI